MNVKCVFFTLTTNYEEPNNARKFSKWSIFTINYHESFEIFTNRANPITHLTVSSLKKVKGKK
jgi:hypothetical protein